MAHISSNTQLAVLTVIVSIMTVVSITYILLMQPESLRLSRDGVPFFTPDVINPDTGKPISVNELVNHFKYGD